MEQSWTTIDKSAWGDGPWQGEPDKVVWIDEATDLDCMIHRGPPGALCGYVGVPRSHPWYGGDFMDHDVDVHGGLTYSAACDEANDICHVPEPGREHDLWWVGFDCGHGMDFSPRHESAMREMHERHPEYGPYRTIPWIDGPPTYKTIAYVQAEVERLAQAAAAA